MVFAKLQLIFLSPVFIVFFNSSLAKSKTLLPHSETMEQTGRVITGE